ncbi:CDP-alcohol phosphatidyltransferase [Leifsonia poae]|uniref:CDP-alcohol phosphatidyltransferase n=1 Tax=Leifsonia poae TaxID=110933 RepID=UPI003D67C863
MSRTREHREPVGAHPVRTTIATVLSAVTLFVFSLAPGLIGSGSALALVRVPLESILTLIVLAFVPWRWVRRTVAIVVATLLVLAAISAALDREFTATVGKPFNVVSGWSELVDGYGVVSDSTGSFAALAILALVIVVAAGAVVAVAASFLHLARVARRHRRPAVIGASAVTASWLVLALVGAQIVPGEPVAAADTVDAAAAKVDQVSVAARDQAAFDKAGATDAYAHLPASDLLTGLKGKDVIVAFIESYGQVAVQNTSFSPGVDAVLKQGNKQLAASGYSERSAFLTSSTFGGISWLAHSTLQSGLWVDSQQKYDQVTAGNRLTLSSAFKKAGWQTVSDVPSDTKPWPVGSSFYQYGKQLNATNVGYAGPRFSYARIPDQYTWSYFQQSELSKPHKPLMAEIDFVSSHTPWTPLPHLVPWDSIGDGSIYGPQPAQGLPPSVVWQDPRHVQQLYGQSIEYSMSSLFSFLTTFDDPNLVLVVLGDHQPATVVSGAGANHQVPISIISKDAAVIDRISSWKWQPGMLPSPTAPVWRMDAFRNRFLDAYGP